jgi:hypothetical protein
MRYQFAFESYKILTFPRHKLNVTGAMTTDSDETLRKIMVALSGTRRPDIGAADFLHDWPWFVRLLEQVKPYTLESRS